MAQRRLTLYLWGGRAVVAPFDGGRIMSDAGALLLRAADRVIGLTRRLAAWFADARGPDLVERAVETLVMQRVVGIATMGANQLRLWFAYVLLCELWRIGLALTQFANATCGTIRLRFLKIGAPVRVSVRRVSIAMESGCSWQHEWALAHAMFRQAAA